jgi:epoxyqueuosine reductase
LFGCDACQDVCPWNHAAPREPAMPGLERERPWHGLEAARLLKLDEAAFLAATEASPLRRPGREGLARNAALVLGNVGERVHLPVLSETAASHASPVVREAAAWALRRIESRAAAPATEPERGLEATRRSGA